MQKIIFIILSFVIYTLAEDSEKIRITKDISPRLSHIENNVQLIVKKNKKKKYYDNLLFSFYYGHGNQNFRSGRFDEFRLEGVQFMYHHRLRLAAGKIYNVDEGFGCCECPSISDYKKYRVNYSAWYISVLIEYDYTYFSWSLGMGFSGREAGYCEEYENFLHILPTLNFNIGKIEKYYITFGYMNNYPVTGGSIPFSLGLGYIFDDSISKIEFRKMGFGETYGFSGSADLKFLDNFLLQSTVKYFMKVERNEHDSNEDVLYFLVGMGYIFDH